MSTLAATNCKSLIADVTAFRTWVGAADQSEALARVLIAGIDAGDETRPFALILTDPSTIDRRVAGGSSDVHEEDGVVWVLLEADSDGATVEEIENTFLNDVGGIVSGMAALAGNGYLRIRSVELVQSIWRCHEDEGDDYMQALFRVEWGTA